MSAISGSGGHRNEEVTRRNREDYQNKEAELIKKHNREVRRMAESHQREVEQLKEIHQNQMKNLQTKSKESMTLRDRKYQKEMDNLRQVQRQQLQKLMVENEAKMARHRQAIAQELKMAGQANDHRVDDLTNNYTQLLREKEETFTSQLEDMRENQSQALKRQRALMNKSHQKELDVLTEGRTQQVGDIQKKYRELRDNSARRIKNQEVRHFADKRRITENHLFEREELQRQAQENSEILRDGFRAGLERQREKYNEAAAQRKQDQTATMGDLQKEVRDRVSGEILSLERKIKDLKSVNVRNQLEEKRKAQQQIDNIEREYEKKLEDYRNQKNQAVEQFNERNADDIAAIRKETSKILKTNNRFYNSRMNMQELKHKQAFESITGDLKSQNLQQKQQAQLRVKNILETTETQEERLRENFTNTVESMRENNYEEKRDLIAEMTRQRDEAVQRIKDQMARNEVRNNQRMTETINRYEKRLGELNDRMTRESRLTAVQQKRMYENLKESHQTQLDATKIQYEDKLAKVNHQHRQEIEDITRRNEAKMNELLRALRKT